MVDENEVQTESTPDVAADGSIGGGGMSEIQRESDGGPSTTQRVKTTAVPWAVKARSLVRTTLQLAGIALVLVAVYNIMLAGDSSSMILIYPTVDVVAIQEDYFVRLGDILAMGVGAVLAWFL